MFKPTQIRKMNAAKKQRGTIESITDFIVLLKSRRGEKTELYL